MAPAIAKSTLYNGALFRVSVSPVSDVEEGIGSASLLQIAFVDSSLAISAFVGAIGSESEFLQKLLIRNPCLIDLRRMVCLIDLITVSCPRQIRRPIRGTVPRKATHAVRPPTIGLER